MDGLRERIVELLTTEWLVNEEEVAKSQTRECLSSVSLLLWLDG